ncbi:putative Anther-specific protein LAT52 precursor [Tripterygium wilfordii]|uniref:Putative Anther-specific protein LAT52 n=1 Tax=Tripterygium wilfordii TaxID=458696 RepID=A0A7J7C6J2_TRIWF|nr:olee1-like protein [Tripterygium wilfordii]KAF5729749.1 putative Anther-specific protein LAT52 precursor [Tripterygium wilfordii]
MAKNVAATALFMAAAAILCFSSLASATARGSISAPTSAPASAPASNDILYVEGRVYCDTCRVQFETKLTEYMEGASVRLECRNRTTDKITYTFEDLTDSNGIYHIPVEGDHEEEICEVRLLKSSRDDCSETTTGRRVGRVLITKNVGVATPIRYANSLGFLQKVALPGCIKELQGLGFLPLD